MGRPQVYYAELDLSGGKIIMRLQDEVQAGMHGWNIVRHTSADYELHFIVEGNAALHLDHSSHNVPQGYAVIIAPNIPHSSTSHSDSMIRFYFNFQAEGKHLQEYLQKIVRSCTVFPVENSTIVLIRKLLETLLGDTPYRQELLESLLSPIMITTLENIGIHPNNTRANTINEDQERRNKIETFFQADLPYGNQEERLSQELGLSKRQLARVLQRYYGMNFREMLLRRRMEHAAWMLRNTDNPVAKIAETLNYTSVSAFSQAFRSVYEKTPTQYRKEQKDRKTTMEP